VRRWIFGVLATFGVTAAIAVPLLAYSGRTPQGRSYAQIAAQVRRLCNDPEWSCSWYQRFVTA
jgi:hypothetical protein